MQRTFEKNIDLEWLTGQITQFFEVRKFEEITATQNAGGFQIIAGDSQHYKMKSDLKVDIRKQTDGFSVSLELARETKKFNYPVMLATFFGGGYFLLKDLKADDSWRKIEKEFWKEAYTIITQAKELASPFKL